MIKYASIEVINAEAFQLTKTMTLDNEILIPQ